MKVKADLNYITWLLLCGFIFWLCIGAPKFWE